MKKPVYLTVTQAALKADLDGSQIRRHCREGRLPALKAGPRVWLILSTDLDTFLKTERKPGRKAKADKA